MAFRPSLRRTHKMEPTEPDLTPVMNLMVVLIPLLLSSAEFIKLGVIELNLPPAAGAKITEAEKPKEVERTLDLSVTITDNGLYISSPTGKIEIPLENGEYNFAELTQKLWEIKQRVIGDYRDTDSIVILAEPQIEYQTLVSTMDATRAIRIDNRLRTLFPQVSVSATLL